MTYQLLPELTPDEYAALREDIATNGIRVPIDVDENGVTLDGHHRQRIADELGITPPTRIVAGLTEQAKRDHALSVNTARRQLNREQRREVLANSMKSDPDLSDREHARRVGCSPSTVAAVRRAMSGEVSKLDTTRVRERLARIKAFRDYFGALVLDDLIENAKADGDTFQAAARWHREFRSWVSEWPNADDPEFIQPVLGIFDRVITQCASEVESMVAEARSQ